MSTTQTRTQTDPLPFNNTQSPPALTIISRVASIPLVSSSLETLNATLSQNAYLSTPYSTAKGFSTSAYKYTEPLQIRLAPLIVRADSYANKAVDVVESRYPYPFHAKPEEVASYVKEKRDSATEYVREQRDTAVNVANKTIDDKVKTPALSVAQGIDQRFAPIVDYFEVAVTRLNHSEAGPSTLPDSKYQYQRAYNLSMNLKDQLYVYSNEQIKQLQTQSVLVQRATETAHSVQDLATSSLANAQSRVHALSDTMLLELQKVQSSTAQLSASLHSSASATQAQIQAHIPASFANLSTSLTSTITDLRTILAQEDVSVQEKVSKLGAEVRDRVSPLLEAVNERLAEVLGTSKKVINENGHAATI